MREEEKKRTSQKSSMQRFFRKRWVFPAVYLVCAALILTAVLWFQNSNGVNKDEFELGSENQNQASNEEPSVPVNQAGEKFQMPVADESAVEIFREFYDVNASAEKQEAALVVYENSYEPNKGIDYVAKDGKEFDVVASLAGTVVRAEKDSLHGFVVEIQHAEGISTMYQSLSSLQVKQGDNVEQGDVLGKAGKNLFDKEAGTHLHFEIRNEGTALNPLEFIGESLTAVEESSEQPAEDKQSDDSEEPADEEEEETPADDEESNDEESEETNSTDASIGMAKA